MPEISNPGETKRKIIEILRLKGPGLPVQIASQLNISSLFAGAFLSELASERLIKISNMKLGGSPLYFLPGHEPALEKFYTYLPGKERQAFLLLKKNKVLDDRKQQPAIRVALRNLKDFAFSFSEDDNPWWRFYSVSEQEVRDIFAKKTPIVKEKLKIKQPIIKQKTRTERQLDIGLKEAISSREAIKPIEAKIKTAEIKLVQAKIKTAEMKVKMPRKTKENFLEKVKLSLQNKNIQLIQLEQIDKRKVIAKVIINSQQCLLAAYNKKRLTEKELIKIHKLAAESNLPYCVMTKDAPTKKMKEAIGAYKNLLKIDQLE